MANILIAYNNAANTNLHGFLQSCADEARQLCTDNNYRYTLLYPPDLTESHVVQSMENFQICFVAAHGDPDGVYNEKEVDVVSTRTTNYVFNKKGFYSIACSCGQNLCPELMRIGLGLFVGYTEPFIVGDNEEFFLDCAMEGLRALLQGECKKEAFHAMLNKFDEVIKLLPFEDQIKLLHNKERLVFAGDDTISINDLI